MGGDAPAHILLCCIGGGVGAGRADGCWDFSLNQKLTVTLLKPVMPQYNGMAAPVEGRDKCGTKLVPVRRVDRSLPGHGH